MNWEKEIAMFEQEVPQSEEELLLDYECTWSRVAYWVTVVSLTAAGAYVEHCLYWLYQWN